MTKSGRFGLFSLLEIVRCYTRDFFFSKGFLSFDFFVKCIEGSIGSSMKLLEIEKCSYFLFILFNKNRISIQF